MENNWLNLINLLKRNLIWTNIIFNEFIKQTSSEFDNLQKKIILTFSSVSTKRKE